VIDVKADCDEKGAVTVECDSTNAVVMGSFKSGVSGESDGVPHAHNPLFPTLPFLREELTLKTIPVATVMKSGCIAMAMMSNVWPWKKR
jgi:hypothetical protein